MAPESQQTTTDFRQVQAEFMLPHELSAAVASHPVAYLPLGSLEFHAAHLPIGLDALSAHGICVRAASRAGGIVLPPLHYGTGGGHIKYPWTIMMRSPDEIRTLIWQSLQRLQEFGFELSVLFTGHFADEQLAMIDEIGHAWESESSSAMRVLSLGVNRQPDCPVEPDHAGIFETSLLAAMWPDRVHLDRLPSLTDAPASDPAGDTRGAHRHQPDHPLWGVFGPDPRGYDLGAAQRLLESQVSWLAAVASSSLKDSARKGDGRRANGVALRAGSDLLPPNNPVNRLNVRPFMTIAPESPDRSAAIAAELPGDLAVFYDPLSYAAYDHPYEVYRRLRDYAPVYYNVRRDLFVVSRYEDVSACLKNHEQMVNALGNDMDGTHDSYGSGNLVAQDPPRHTVLRAVVRPSFAAREILAMEEHIRELSRELLAKLRKKDGADFAGDFALPLVFGVGLRLVGAPTSETEFWQAHLLRSMARTVGEFGIPEDAANSNREAEKHLGEIMRRRREEIEAGGEADTPDVISQILLAGAKGLIDKAEQIGLAHLILSASTDAPAALLTNCIAVLDKFPALQGYLRQDPSLIKAFVEETLRYDTPATNLCRQTTTEVNIGGITIPENRRVMVLMGSANRDERAYENPDAFDLFRTFTGANKILSFGEGIHSCMGAPLIRLTAQIAVEEIVAALDDTELRVVGVPERWAKQMVRGFAKLPVKFVHSPRSPRMYTAAALANPESHVESVQHRSTRLTLAAREFEADVRVASKILVADGVAALTLRELDEHPLPWWQPGAHVDLIIDGVQTRQYSLCGDPDDYHAWRLGILRDPQGSGASLYVHDQLNQGDIVRVRGPRNNFPLVDSPRYLFIAGGIGITPILPMIATAEAAGAEWHLVYGGRARASMAFLDELARYGDKVSVRPQDETGLLDLDGLLRGPRPDTKVYCCGPEPLLAAVEERCAAWPRRFLHVERFAAKPLSEPVLSEAFEVYLAQSDLTLTVPPDASILSVVEGAGVGVLSSCAEGTCGTCETSVLEGIPDHRDSVLDQDEREAGNCMMICVSRSCTPRLVLDI